MNRLREVLVERHIGAVIVGLILSQGISSLVAVLLSPFQNAMIRVRGSVLDQVPPIFSKYELIVGSARAVVTIAIGLLLLKWLYLAKKGSVEEEHDQS